uniref:Uncharacterized protein n=1 Tax=Rhizophora mucronata TaxID=61149 RepID=A0A2P2L8V6_RHIMU
MMYLRRISKIKRIHSSQNLHFVVVGEGT